MDSPSQVLAHQLILDQKVKGQRHRVTKCKKVIEWLVRYVEYTFRAALLNSKQCRKLAISRVQHRKPQRMETDLLLDLLERVAHMQSVR